MADVVKKGGYHQLVVNFLGVLVQNRRLARCLPFCSLCA